MVVTSAWPPLSLLTPGEIRILDRPQELELTNETTWWAVPTPDQVAE